MVPSRCPACRRPGRLPGGVGICARCRATFAAAAPQSIQIDASAGFAAFSAVPYLPPATGLVAGLKSGRIPAAASIAAELIAEAIAEAPAGAVLVPVGAAPLRRLRRGLDPAEEIALALADRIGLDCRPGLLRRRGGRSQRGRSRVERLASPPRFEIHGRAPALALIVDDVVTTGATLAACAAALRGCGSEVSGAISFAWTPAPGFP